MEKSMISGNHFNDEECYCLVCIGTFSKSKRFQHKPNNNP